MKSHLLALLDQALVSLSAALGRELPLPAGLQIDATKDTRHGDFATNLALVVAKPLGQPPRAVAEQLLEHLPASKLVAKVEIAGPGFINFFLAPAAFQSVVSEVLRAGAAYGCDSSKSRGKILVEYVSANPTGPMHVGHGRGAAYGDSLANILAATGWDVYREYYVNDAGRQVDALAVSVWLRYLELTGLRINFPKRAYPADYIKATAAKLKQTFGDAAFRIAGKDLSLVPPDPVASESASDAELGAVKAEQERNLDSWIRLMREGLHSHYVAVRRVALDDQLETIKATLKAFGIEFDNWVSEQELVSSGAVGRALKRLSDQGLTEMRDGALWMKTKSFGDEKDRVLVKADGAATYYCNDLAYHIDKLDRGFPHLLDVWGADHHGYIARVRAAIEALTGAKDALRVQLMQFVTLSSGKMGKRSGNFVTLHDLIAEAGRDATRFFYLLRSHDQHLEFDIELARSQSNDNPVFYVQYAHARICSVFRQLAERGQSFDAANVENSLHRLVEPQEKHLLAVMQKYPETLVACATQYAPHLLAFYLRDLADALHSDYNAHKFLSEDTELQSARLALIRATQQVLVNGLRLLGVSAPETM